ncbi:hypothetical protein ES703_103176 [subsurface metagenome]
MIKFAAPSAPPLQLTFVPIIFNVSGAIGSVIVTHALVVHKFVSVTVTQYIPATLLLKSSVVSPVFH